MLRLGAGAMRQTECARLPLPACHPWAVTAWETPWKQLSRKTTKTHISICAFWKKYLLTFKAVEMLGVITLLIILFKAGEENLAVDPERKLSQHHPRKACARAGNRSPRWASQGGNACQTHYMMPQVTEASQQSSPCLTATNYEWMPNLTTSVNLSLVCSAQTI